MALVVWTGLAEALGELKRGAVRVDEPLVCPLCKGGADGRLPLPKPSPVFYSKMDVCGVPATDLELRRAWKTTPSEALLRELGHVEIQGSAVHMDADRTAFVAEFASLASDLDHGLLYGNCHGRLVVGPKGTGKSSLLQALVLAVQKLAKHTIAIWVDAAAVDGAISSPALVIKRAMEELLPAGCSVPPDLVTAADAGDISRVLDVVQLMGLRVLLIVDEYATVFSKPARDGERWTRQMYAMGQRATHPQMHMVVLSGSAPYMRSMCFGKLPLNEALYPSYTGRAMNLNSERFQVRSLGPIVTEEGLRQFIQTCVPSRAAVAAKADPRKLLRQRSALHGFFVATGGNHRRMDGVLRTLSKQEAPHQSLYKVTDQATKYEPLWRAMVDVLVAQRDAEGKGGTLADDPWSLMQWIPWPSLGTKLADMPLADRFTAADDGAIAFDQSMSTDRARFVAPIQPLLLQERSTSVGAIVMLPALYLGLPRARESAFRSGISAI